MHHLVHDEGDLRVLDVQIQPGETTLYHTHDAAIAYVPIDTSPSDNQPVGGQWEGTRGTDPPRFSVGTVTWNLRYASAPHTHRVRNVGERLFRLIAVVNYGTGTAGVDASPILGERPDAECRWFRWRQVVLEPGKQLEGTNGTNKVVVVQTTGGCVRATGGTSATLARPGDFIVLDPKALFRLEVASAESVGLCAVEVRATTPTPTPAIR